MDIETKYLIREKSYNGQDRYYYRKKPGRRIRIRAEYGTDAFLRKYRLAEQGLDPEGLHPEDADPEGLDRNGHGGGEAAPAARSTRPAPPAPAPALHPINGSLREVASIYYQSPEFKALGEGTRYVRRKILDRLCAQGGTASRPPYGDRPAAKLEARHVRRMRDANAAKPHSANGLLKALRQLYTYAIEAELAGVTANPARDVPYITSSSQGFHAWTLDEVERFERCHPVGSMARLALALMIYTGQRRSDVIRFGPGHVRDGWISFTQHKGRTRKPVAMELPVLSALRQVIEATPDRGADTFLVTRFGKPFTDAGFGNWFGKRCEEAGVPGRAHGLRKAAAARLAELGCSDREIMAVTGHTTTKEIDRYTRSARQRVLAQSAFDRLEAEHDHPEDRSAETAASGRTFERV